jgi:aminoglycoside phosphotransferase (APT) family kinase protein
VSPEPLAGVVPDVTADELTSSAFVLPPDAVPFASGRDADVYAVDKDKVLRRYRDGHRVTAEAEVMRYAARHGFPVPTVHHVDGPDMVIQRLSGPTVAEAALDGRLSPTELGLMHADLHRRLHAIPVPSGTNGFSLMHCDLHPENVLLTAYGPVVIDWRDAREGPPEFDIAMTAIILAQVALDPSFRELSDLVCESLAVYLEASISPSPQLEAALTRRGNNPTLTEEELALLPAQAALIRSYLTH